MLLCTAVRQRIINIASKEEVSLHKLALSSGIPYSTLSSFMNGKSNSLTLTTLLHLCEGAHMELQISLLFKEYDEAERYFMECIENEDEEIQAESYFYLSKIKLINNENTLAVQYANIALELEPKLIEKMEKDMFFAPILGKLKTKENKIVKTKLTKVEKNIINYLDKTYGVVQTLTLDKSVKEKEEKEREF